MGCHTWFFKDSKIAMNDDSSDEEFENNCVDEFHDIFRYARRNEDGSYPDKKLLSQEETLQFFIEENQYIKFNTSRDEVLNRIYSFWKLYPNGVIEFE